MPTPTIAAGAPAALKHRIQALLAGASLEVISRDPEQVAICRDLLSPGTEVYVAHEPKAELPDIAAQAARLVRAGLRPVPHIVARRIPSRDALDRALATLAGEGVDMALAVGGDLDRPEGPFASTGAVIETGLFARHGFRRIGLAGHPEGHPTVAAAVMEAALPAKLAQLRGQGIAPLVVTQFCFEAAPILDWVARLRASGEAVAVHAGLAGPAGVATLIRFALRCGVGNSLRALRRQGERFGKLLSDAGPEAVIQALSETPANGLEGLHFFVFGGIAKTAGWLQAAQRGSFELTGDGFRVIR